MINGNESLQLNHQKVLTCIYLKSMHPHLLLKLTGLACGSLIVFPGLLVFVENFCINLFLLIISYNLVFWRLKLAFFAINDPIVYITYYLTMLLLNVSLQFLVVNLMFLFNFQTYGMPVSSSSKVRVWIKCDLRHSGV